MARNWWTTIISSYPDGIVPVPTSSISHDSVSEESTGRDTRTTESASLSEALPTPPQSPLSALRALSLASSAPVATEITTVVASAPAAEPQANTMAPSASSSDTTATALATPPASPLPAPSPTIPPVTDQDEAEATTPGLPRPPQRKPYRRRQHH